MRISMCKLFLSIYDCLLFPNRSILNIQLCSWNNITNLLQTPVSFILYFWDTIYKNDMRKRYMINYCTVYTIIISRPHTAPRLYSLVVMHHNFFFLNLIIVVHLLAYLSVQHTCIYRTRTDRKYYQSYLS